MKLQKRLLSFFLALIMVLSLAGCIAGAPDGTTAPPTSDSGITDDTGTLDTPTGTTENPTEPPVSIPDESEPPEPTVPSEPTQPTQPTVPSEPTQPTDPPDVGTGTASPVNPAELPAYSGSAYIVVNNNKPNFSASELSATGYEKYSPLDSLGRCGVALASCGKDTMPAQDETRGDISSVKPTGWVQAKYEGISGGYLWNRCHLIGWQLSAENANKQNLITGTRYMNIEGMLPFENMVADYIKETGNHVAYRITPIFEGSNLVCSGVQMEAYSVEDSGEGICFNVYCYNVQPGITIDYATGNSSGPSTGTTEDSKPAEGDGNTSESDETMVWVTQSGSKYHCSSDCSGMKNPSQITKEEAEQRGYEPCKKCYK